MSISKKDARKLLKAQKAMVLEQRLEKKAAEEKEYNKVSNRIKRFFGKD